MRVASELDAHPLQQQTLGAYLKRSEKCQIRSSRNLKGTWASLSYYLFSSQLFLDQPSHKHTTSKLEAIYCFIKRRGEGGGSLCVMCVCLSLKQIRSYNSFGLGLFCWGRNRKIFKYISFHFWKPPVNFPVCISTEIISMDLKKKNPTTSQHYNPKSKHPHQRAQTDRTHKHVWRSSMMVYGVLNEQLISSL